MTGRLARRLFTSLIVLFGVLLVGFLMLQVMPADPAAALAGAQGSEAEITSIRSHLGLDRPLAVQFGLYLARVAQGDPGVSSINSAPVAGALRGRLPSCWWRQWPGRCRPGSGSASSRRCAAAGSSTAR